MRLSFFSQWLLPTLPTLGSTKDTEVRQPDPLSSLELHCPVCRKRASHRIPLVLFLLLGHLGLCPHSSLIYPQLFQQLLTGTPCLRLAPASRYHLSARQVNTSYESDQDLLGCLSCPRAPRLVSSQFLGMDYTAWHVWHLAVLPSLGSHCSSPCFPALPDSPNTVPAHGGCAGNG